MNGDGSLSGRPPRPSRTLLWIVFATLLLTASVVGTGVGLVAFLGQHGDDDTWSRWSSIGQAFGVVNSVVSALAIAALVVTSVTQSRDQRDHRTEVALREMHVSLIHMAVNNPHLADLWPSVAGADSVAKTQHMYANLLLQHVWLQYTTGVASHEEMISNLRLLFASPTMRSYWRDSTDTRHGIYVKGTEEFSLAMAAEEIWREYEAVLARSAETSLDRSVESKPERLN